MAQHKNIGGSGTEWIASAIFTKIKAKLDALVIPTVNNTVTSTSTTQALSANMGTQLANANKIIKQAPDANTARIILEQTGIANNATNANNGAVQFKINLDGATKKTLKSVVLNAIHDNTAGWIGDYRLALYSDIKNLNVQEYEATITSGTQFTQQLAHYSTLKLLEVYVNGLRCQSSEYSVSAAGLFSLTNTLTGSGNTIKIVEWYT